MHTTHARKGMGGRQRTKVIVSIGLRGELLRRARRAFVARSSGAIRAAILLPLLFLLLLIIIILFVVRLPAATLIC